MKKRLFASILASLMLIVLLAPAAYADETEGTEETLAQLEAEPVNMETSGTCGEGITWELEGNVLRVTGSGKMADGCPWEYYKDKIKKVVFSGGITYVGAKSFLECENLVAIDFGDALHTIGAQAFKGCTDLVSIQLPASFRKFENDAFMDCYDLESVYCQGPMPSFRGYCLYNGGTVTIYTPVGNPWPAEEIDRLRSNYGSQLDIITGGAEEPYEEPYVATEAPTEPPTEPPTEAPTEPPAPPLPPVAERATEAPAEPPTEALPAAQTLAATEATEVFQLLDDIEPEGGEKALDVVEEVSNNGWIGMVIVAGVFTFLIVGALIFKLTSRKGGRYKS